MKSSVLAQEFERLATRNAELLYTEAGDGQSLAESKEKSDEFEANLVKLEDIKALLEKEREFNALQTWAATPERQGAAFAPEAPERPQARKPGGPAAQVLASAEFKAWLDQIAPDGKISDHTNLESAKFPVDALITGGDATSGGAFFETDYTGLYVPYVQPQLTVRDLVINATTDADVVEFVRAVTHANAAAETGEATTADDAALSYDDPDIVVDTTGMGLKPEGSFTWEKVTQTVVPIAEGVPITKRAIMNGGQMRSIINDQLGYDIERRLNGQMLAGSGSGDNLRGIRNTSGILTQSFSSNVIQTLRKGKTKVSSPATGSGKPPTGAVLTPDSLETLDLFRVGGSTTTDGPFIVSPFGDRPTRIWGMNIVEDSAMTASHAIVGFFRDAVLWDREQATVQIYDQYKDFPRRNLTYVQGEGWFTFGVLQPKSFCDCTMA